MSLLYLQNSRCYANTLGGCTEKNSGEHYISKSVLRALDSARLGAVAITNHRWQREARQAVGIGSLNSKVLCTAHNSLLSGLDTQMANFVTTMFQINAILGTGTEDREFIFEGHEIERWLLKALCGAMRSGNFQAPGAGSSWTPPVSWLQILFQGQVPPAGLGLYVCANCSDEGTVIKRSLYLAPLTARSDIVLSQTVIGVSLWLFGLRFILVLSDPRYVRGSLKLQFGSNSQAHYRPDALRWATGAGNCYVSVRLRWQQPRRMRKLTATYRWEPHDSVGWLP